MSVDALLERPAWHAEAACRDVDTGVFFSPKGGDLGPAREVCDRCPVAGECLAEALERNEQHGVWAGTSRRQRQKLRRVKPTPDRRSLDDGRWRELCRLFDDGWEVPALATRFGIDNRTVYRWLGRGGRTNRHNRRFNPDQVLTIRRRVAAGDSQRNVARDMGIRQSQVSLIVNRRTYAWVEEEAS